MTNPEVGYLRPDTAPGSDGFVSGTWADDIHPEESSKIGYYRAMAPYIAAAAIGSL